MRRVRRLSPAFAIALIFAASLGSHVIPVSAADNDLQIATPVVKPNEFDSLGSLTGAQLGALIETALGKAGYQQVTTILSTCHSGAGLDPFKAKLTGAYNLIASCGAKQTMSITTDQKTNTISGFVPGLLDSIIANPKISVDDAFKKGSETDSRVPKGATPAEQTAWEANQKTRYEAYRYSFRAYAQKELDKAKAEHKPDNVIAQLQKRLNSALGLPDWDKGGRDLKVQDPASVQSAGVPMPGQSPIAVGTKSNHAIIYQAYSPGPGTADSAETAKAKEAFQKAGFTTIDVLSPLTSDDYMALKKQQADGKPFSVPDNRATPDNLKKKLEALQPGFNKNEALTVVMISHGGLILSSDRTQGAAGVGGGTLFASNTVTTDHIGDEFTSTLLMEEMHSTALGEPLVDYSFFVRWAQPSLAIQTVDESNPSGRPVEVFLNDLFLGALSLHNGGPGYYDLPLSDSFLENLITQTDLMDGLDLSFSFGGAGDYLKLATVDDLTGLDGGLGRYGISLTVHLDGVVDVSEPGSLSLVIGAAAILGTTTAHRRRRRNVTPEHPSPAKAFCPSA